MAFADRHLNRARTLPAGQAGARANPQNRSGITRRSQQQRSWQSRPDNSHRAPRDAAATGPAPSAVTQGGAN